MYYALIDQILLDHIWTVVENAYVAAFDGSGPDLLFSLLTWFLIVIVIITLVYSHTKSQLPEGGI
jgi:hypothetical protein